MARVLIASGGTGGHIFPSVALANQLKEEGFEVLLAGAKLASNPYLSEKGLPHKEIASKPGLKGLPYVGKGTLESLTLIKSFKPDLVVGFGSYTAFPLLLAAKLKNIPTILWAADAHPGKVIRWFSPYAKMTAVHFPEAAKHLKGAQILGLMPLREGFQKDAFSKEASLNYFGLDEKHPVLLVVGGSQGANFLNTMAPKSLERLPKGLQILHIAGNEKECLRVSEAYKKIGAKAVVKPFEPELHHAWRIADIALTRAGAVSLREQLEFEVPGVMVPYPLASDNHQEENAKYLQASGLSELLQEKRADPDKLSKLLMSVLFSGNLRKEKAKRFKKNHPSKSLMDIVRDYLNEAT